MRRDLLGTLQTAAIPEIGGNSRRQESVISDLCMNGSALRTPPNHPVGVRLAERPPCECIGFPGPYGTKAPWDQFRDRRP